MIAQLYYISNTQVPDRQMGRREGAPSWALVGDADFVGLDAIVGNLLGAGRIFLLGRLGGEDRALVGAWHHCGARRSTDRLRSEEHTSELQSLMRISYAVLCLIKKHEDKKKQIRCT